MINQQISPNATAERICRNVCGAQGSPSKFELCAQITQRDSTFRRVDGKILTTQLAVEQYILQRWTMTGILIINRANQRDVAFRARRR
jgi:hypothetical protein